MADLKAEYEYYKSQKICVIPARGGSKGVPGKNLRELGGEPLIVWTIRAAILSQCFERVIVSSDCPNIQKICLSLDVEFDLRPPDLAGDEVHASKVVIEIVERVIASQNFKPDVVAMLLPTSPFRTAEHIKLAANIIDLNKYESVVGVVRSGKYMNNVRMLRSNSLEALVGFDELNAQRQEQEELLFVNGAIFFAKTESLLSQLTFHMMPCAPIEMDYHSSVDINSEEDFMRAEKALMEG
jgi:CMP-N-acetylneuraminic acid synthetase